jgi:hypothetical protein
VTRPCTGCGGQKTVVRELTRAFPEGIRTYGKRAAPCIGCGGIGEFSAPDLAAILAAIVENDGTLRSNQRSRPENPRAYYVWNMARVIRGADLVLLKKVRARLGGDPWVEELDQIAWALAPQVVTKNSWPRRAVSMAK